MERGAKTAGRASAAAKRLFAAPAVFVGAAAGPGSLPATGLPEVAFAGRSNAGKSSLINALTGRRQLARISKTPGRTRQVNVFEIGARLRLIDLPGYGYARAGKGEIAHWTEAMLAFLAERASLRYAVLLLDARRGAMDADREACRHFDAIALAYRIVLTKADKVKEAERGRTMAAVADELGGRPAAFPRILATSARSGEGIGALQDDLAALAAEAGVA